MNKQARQAIAQATVKNIKTEEYLNEFRQDKQLINKAIYLALGVNMEGNKELPGIWLSWNWQCLLSAY